MKFSYFLATLIIATLTSCSNQHNLLKPKPIEMDIIDTEKNIANTKKNILKRKVAILRFDNKSKYGKSKLFNLDLNYKVDQQAYDILYTKLAESDKFLLFDNIKDKDIYSLPVDYVIVGAITEFGKRDITQKEIILKTKTQEVYAKVDIRVIDIKSHQVIFATEGSGSAKISAKSSMLLNKINDEITLSTEISDDTILKDRAISSAISSVVDNIIVKMTDKPWRSYILSKKDNNIIIAGATNQGLKIGDRYKIYKKGQKILNPQTNTKVELPGTMIATLEVISQFGTNYSDEGSICRLVDSDIDKFDIKDLYVQE
jgi:curli biogenesis system outer membrane secretion channel CsgG